MKKFTFILFLTFMSVMTIHANVLIDTCNCHYDGVNPQFSTFGDESYFTCLRKNIPSQLQPGHVYTISIAYPNGYSYTFSAPYTCNLDNPEEMELFGIDNGTIEDPNGYVGLYNIAEDVIYEDTDMDDYPPGSNGDWMPEDYAFFEITTGFFARIYGSGFGTGTIIISIYD